MDNLLSPALELTPPDISAWRRGNGSPTLDYVHSFDSGVAGPHVVVSALVHGNELCGAIALDRLLSAGLRPEAGRLSYVFVNVAAYERFTAAAPHASRFLDEDFNRLWAPEILKGKRRSRELERARALRPLFDSADFLLDIHSMSTTTEPLIMAGPADKGLALARRLGRPATIVRDGGHAAGPRLRDYAGFIDPASPRNALLIECGQHFALESATVAFETALRFLAAVGSLSPATVAGYGVDCAPAPQRVIEVTERITAAGNDFAFARPFRGMDVLAEAGTVIARDGGKPVVTPYDDCVLIMPVAHPQAGATAVRLGREVG
ncbi:succinylglutamate desuccinylase/aspartoacylase domain-containing protein [Pelagibius marinus]|uniref:succinylglutamate desuccinylase/aspartoacylase domain-containing protein n=1 Tax=Pelagibius marinus TaxID=2762760 RepID=UPI0018724CCF|nr:succinylglutamate desuccinylase/aspartoacylase family protein [Pelagibius marinus]